MDRQQLPVPVNDIRPTPSTTFVQTDASTFRELVQRLTGPHDESRHPSPSSPPLPAASTMTSTTLTMKATSPALTTTTTLATSNGNQSIATPPPSPSFTAVRRPTFKLYERRQGMKPKLMMLKPNTLHQAMELGFTSTSPRFLSPSPLSSPSNHLSKLLICERENAASTESELNEEEEEKAIKDRRFYLHPSPRPRTRNASAPPPELLPLFPLTSPKAHQS